MADSLLGSRVDVDAANVNDDRDMCDPTDVTTDIVEHVSTIVVTDVHATGPIDDGLRE